jgi:hypothetical protein
MFELKKSSEDVEERFRRLFIPEMTRGETGYSFLATLLSGGEYREKKNQTE